LIGVEYKQSKINPSLYYQKGIMLSKYTNVYFSKKVKDFGINRLKD